MSLFASGMLILVLTVVSKVTSKQPLCRWSIPATILYSWYINTQLQRKCAKSRVFFAHVKKHTVLALLQFVIQTIKVHCYYKRTHSSVHCMSVGKCCQMTSSVPLLSRKQYSHWLLAAKYVSQVFSQVSKIHIEAAAFGIEHGESGDEQLNVYLLSCSVTFRGKFVLVRWLFGDCRGLVGLAWESEGSSPGCRPKNEKGAGSRRGINIVFYTSREECW